MKIVTLSRSTWIQKHGYDVDYLRHLIETNVKNMEISQRNFECGSQDAQAQFFLEDAREHCRRFIRDYEAEIARIEAGGRIHREIHTSANDLTCGACQEVYRGNPSFYEGEGGFLWRCQCKHVNVLQAPHCTCCPKGTP